MKYIIIAVLSILSLTTFSKGGGGGHSSGSHSSSSHSSESHTSSTHESHGFESNVSEHIGPAHTNCRYPNGIFYSVVHNNRTNKVDTLTANSQEALNEKIKDNDSYDPILTPVLFLFVVMCFVILFYIIYLIFKNIYY